MPAWDRPARSSRSRTARSPLDRLAEAALRRDGVARILGMPPDKVRGIWVTGPGCYGRNDAGDCAMDCRACSRRRSASRCGCNTPASRAPDGIRRARPRSTAPARRSTRRARSSPTSSSARGSARRRQFQREPAVRHAGGPAPGVAAEVRRRLRRPGGILRVRQQAHLLGDDPAAARSRLAVAHLASARPGRTANPLRQRVVHGRSGGRARSRPDRVPAAPHQGSARHRGGQGGGRESRLESRPSPRKDQTGNKVSGRGFAYVQRTAPAWRSWPRSMSIVRPARSGRKQVHGRRTIAGRSSIRTASSTPSRAMSCRASAARCGKRSSSTTRA